jgi:DNA-binding MarR family transcriptional regulator
MAEEDGGLGPHRHKLFGFRPDPAYVDSATAVLGERKVAPFLEASLRWVSADPEAALAAIGPWLTPRVRFDHLAAILRDKIDSGELRGRLPTAATLAKDHGIHRETVYRALEALEAEGFIAPVPVSSNGRKRYDAVPKSRRRRPHPATPRTETAV